jgi:hypothetical protein
MIMNRLFTTLSDNAKLNSIPTVHYAKCLVKNVYQWNSSIQDVSRVIIISRAGIENASYNTFPKLICVLNTYTGCPKFAEQLNEAMSIHVRK